MSVYTYTRYALANLLATATLSGTLATTATTNTITGTGTAFLTELVTNDILRLNGRYHVINNVTSNGVVTVRGLAFDYTASGMQGAVHAWRLFAPSTDLAGCPEPKGVFIPYSKPLRLANAQTRAGGWKAGELRWGFIKQAYREALRAHILGASSEVVVAFKQYDSSDAFHIYQAVAEWPVTEDRQTGRRLDFSLSLRAMVQLD